MKSCKRKNHLVVEIIRNEREIQLERTIEQLQATINNLENQVQHLTAQYGFESQVNNELIDLLSENRINFRPALDRAHRR